MGKGGGNSRVTNEMSPEASAAIAQRQAILNSALRGIGTRWAGERGVPLSSLPQMSPPSDPNSNGPATDPNAMSGGNQPSGGETGPSSPTVGDPGDGVGAPPGDAAGPTAGPAEGLRWGMPGQNPQSNSNPDAVVQQWRQMFGGSRPPMQQVDPRTSPDAAQAQTIERWRQMGGNAPQSGGGAPQTDPNAAQAQVIEQFRRMFGNQRPPMGGM